MAASWGTQLVVRSLEEVDLVKHHSCEVSGTVEIDHVGVCIRKDYIVEATRRGHS